MKRLADEADPAPVKPAIAVRAPEVVRREVAGIRFEGVAFDSRSHRLRVADQVGGPGSRWADAEAVARDFGGLAAANAGFFTPEGDPLGKVVADGNAAGAWNRSSSLGSGVWMEDGSGAMSIRRREHASAEGVRELLQAGPMLVDRGRAVDGLDATKVSVRSMVLWDGGSRWWLGRAADCSLAGLGAALAAEPPAGWPVAMALNLDGGRSCDLSVSAGVSGGPLVRRALWNRPVRNFLVLVPRGG
ncbi:MAG: phosphodiester glycosidase family protein [Verrucomicrobia bacterium]|nr:phosphodiester glycosidase family protein [Verrucomicrobiota bacterium]